MCSALDSCAVISMAVNLSHLLVPILQAEGGYAVASPPLLTRGSLRQDSIFAAAGVGNAVPATPVNSTTYDAPPAAPADFGAVYGRFAAPSPQELAAERLVAQFIANEVHGSSSASGDGRPTDEDEHFFDNLGMAQDGAHAGQLEPAPEVHPGSGEAAAPAVAVAEWQGAAAATAAMQAAYAGSAAGSSRSGRSSGRSSGSSGPVLGGRPASATAGGNASAREDSMIGYAGSQTGAFTATPVNSMVHPGAMHPDAVAALLDPSAELQAAGDRTSSFTAMHEAVGAILSARAVTGGGSRSCSGSEAGSDAAMRRTHSAARAGPPTPVNSATQPNGLPLMQQPHAELVQGAVYAPPAMQANSATQPGQLPAAPANSSSSKGGQVCGPEISCSFWHLFSGRLAVVIKSHDALLLISVDLIR